MRRRHQPQRQREDQDADRQVDEEDPVPVERVREDAAEQHADTAAARHHEAEEPHRLGALGWFGEQHHDQREGDRRYDGAAETLHRARSDQEPLRAREPAGERCEREKGDPAEEQPAVAEEIAEPPAEQQEAAEREEVGVDHPGE